MDEELLAAAAPSSSEEAPARRQRLFDEKMRRQCWHKADVVPGRHPERWRKDGAGNIVCRKLIGCEGCMCYEFDHIRPFSKATYTCQCGEVLQVGRLAGGETDVRNCQILQSRVNRLKSNKDVDGPVLQQYSCHLKFADKELDLIEMAVYGNVVRPGLQCRCKSVAETLGTALHKSKGNEAACELPYKEAQNSAAP